MIEREGVESAADIAIVGTEDDVRRRILALAEIGVTDLVAGEVLAPGETDTLRTRSLLAELARGRVSAT
jgi:alkanesulfonate monooxygenase SsuD/methylene tetrahydromethanopterin reductase-like flavin-dependent oxidoreductase (luciferase family)